ncbi:MAG TPA: tRNA (guanosine(37)-N1)-methyltransferase TrmD [Oligoflexia bacterium]|nr:tRNA (guanosine(37)-N1)-methyltransferase TrmD [Oligoflexia bacterium]
MKYQVLTLFPELISPFLGSTLLSKACSAGSIKIDVKDIRTFAINRQGQVDDTPYGGGGGMVARVESSSKAVEEARNNQPGAKVILFPPRGQRFTQKLARSLVSDAIKDNTGFILYCPRYEGIDERFSEAWVDFELSVGDAIYMGGEVPALAFIEATARLVPGVLGNSESTEEESFELGGLEYPQYTKPRIFRGKRVPDVLLSGNHRAISEWRLKRSIEDTSLRRPDLLSESLQNALPIENLDKTAITRPPVYLGLLHYPVVDKQGEIITSSITNLDVHDIARSVRTFELDAYYLVHPSQTLRRLVKRVCDHWSDGTGRDYNPNRSDALQYIRAVATFDDMLSDISEIHGCAPRIVITSARLGERMLAYDEFRALIPNLDTPLLILFGTGWGIHSSITDRADYRLQPIWGPGDYNHLSVRSAVAIILDRLFGF